MPKPIQLQIPKPCDASWNEMEKTDKGRFCMSCQKQVVDFSVMSDREILAYISKSKGNLCGHFYPDQLNRDLSVKQERKLGWFRHFIQLMIPALVIVNRTSAQVKFKGDTIVCAAPEKRAFSVGKLAVKEAITSEYTIKGRIIDDESGEPIGYSTIVIKGTKQGVVSDSDGNFRIVLSKPGDIVLQTSRVGYEAKELLVHIVGDQKLELTTISIVTKKTTSGGLVVVSTTTRKTIDTSVFQKIRNIVIPKKTIDTLKIYPNPVSAGAKINLAFDVNKTGEYSVAMINISGQPVLQKNVRVDNIKQTEQLPCDPRLPKGIYTLQIINLSTKKIYNNKILVL